MKAELTQTQVAKALGRPQSYVADIESGQRRLDLVEFLNLARVIEFDPQAFLAEILASHSVE